MEFPSLPSLFNHSLKTLARESKMVNANRLKRFRAGRRLLPSAALTTDLYEVTMTCGYWEAGVNNHDAVFHATFRENPFGGQFTVACGLATAIDFLRAFHFTETQVDYLGSQHGNDGKPLFDSGFLDYLRTLQLTCDIDAIPEGTLVFPDEPLIRVVGPIAQCQLLETALLNIFNFQSLITTKAARVCLAAKGDPVIEFGLRRSQGVDGGLTAARAAYIGGCAGTSNLQAGQQFGIPVSGTQAHSWIMFFENELEAFKTHAEAMPNNCIFLVDTYDSIDGIRHAIEVAAELRRQGHEMIGVRLDSGDGAALSIKARRMLDEAGFTNAKIVGSGDLDEYMITDLKRRGAKIDVWGVGTKLATGPSRTPLSVASIDSARPGAPVANGNTTSNSRKNQRKLRFQAHFRFGDSITLMEDSSRMRFMKLITAFPSSVKLWTSKQKIKRRSLRRLPIPICSCRFSDPGKLFMKRRASLRRASTCVNSSVARLPRFCT
jgi:putative nicotinate phosphoribosyltransferase